MDRDRIITYIGISAIILLLFGLGGWYIFVRSETSRLGDAANARGFSVGIPSFSGSRGSTAANTAASEENTFGSSGSASTFARFLGFGAPARTDAPPENTSNPAGIQTPDAPERRTPRLWRVTTTPVAGAGFLSGTGKLRYVERATGHVFDADPTTGDVVRVTNTLTPKVYEAQVGGGGIIVQRIIDEGRATTLAGKIGTTTDGVASLSTHNLGVDVPAIALSPDSSDLVLIAKGAGGTHLIRSAWNGSSPKQLVPILGGDFRILWQGTSIALVERAGSGILGNAYRVASPLIPLVRGIPGLTLTIQAATGALLYGSDDGETLRLYAQLPNASAVEIPLATVADKCVWAPKGSIAYCAAPQGNVPPLFLDEWYRGEVHTEDLWYTIDAAAGKTQTLYRIESGTGVDVENPAIDAKGEYLAFQNARDKSLWILRIAE